MNRALTLVILVLFLFAGTAAAQDNPFLGTWKLNAAKSKLPASAPTTLTRTVEASGDAYKYTFMGKDASGADLKYTFTLKYDGKAVPVTGNGMPMGADAVAIKSVTSHKYSTMMMKGGKQVGKGVGVVSKDGKTTTLWIKGKGADGKTVSTESVYEKQ